MITFRHAAALALMLCCISTSCPGQDSEPRYSTQGLLPKAETGALRFLEEHPEYDGRGVVVAIFDTGVDPGAPGLRTTTDGQTKVVDLIDGTGSGDVETTTIRTADELRIEGAGGRTLTLHADWECPSGEFHVGWKRGFELFPGELVSRLKTERRREWDAGQRLREAELREQLAAIDPPNSDNLAERKEIQARIDVLLAARQEYEDPGPIYDCVVFNDGEKWRAVIDTDEDGDLADESLLTNYRDEHQYASFGGGSQLNFSVNIYREGDRLSIVTVTGNHGTHVAGIVAANFPGASERNGVAPGAQIVSVKIGDTRLDGMETGVGLVRGIKAVLDNNCDLVNMSYGEPTSTPGQGRLVELLSELVTEHGVIFVASAGNSGPALSTVGAPGGTTSSILGVGAYVSPAMMRAEYALREIQPDLPYTWTSRGPTTDGHFGVDLFAPGGAIAPVPTYTLRPSQRMNGTSMASPNACGGFALLLSGLKAEELAFSPASVLRALQNTAERLDVDPFAQGPGLIQIDRAYDHLQQWGSAPGAELSYTVRILSRNGARGLYLREQSETDGPSNFTVNVKPAFAESAPPAARREFEIPVVLESTADWVTAGSQLLLTSGGANFEVRVDPDVLEPGAHLAEVHGFDANRPDQGPLFRVPVVVIKPDSEDEPGLKDAIHLEPGRHVRRFLPVPQGTSWVDVTLRLDADTPRTILFHAVQLSGGRNFEDGEFQSYLSLTPDRERTVSFAVEAGHILEICLAQYWSNLGESDVEFEVEFRGLNPSVTEIGLPSSGDAIAVNVSAHQRSERCAPEARLSTYQRLLRPRSSQLALLDAGRDAIPDNRRVWQSVLEYDLSLSKRTGVTLRCPELESLLYDAPIDSFRWMVYDENKRFQAARDMFPESVTLGKGKYTLRLELRHTNRETLEATKSLLVAVERDLSSPVTVDLYASRTDALTDGSSFATQTLDAGETATLWLRGPDSVPGGVEAGDVLMGEITYVETRNGAAGGESRPGGFPVRFVVPPRAGETDDSASTDDSDGPELTTAEQIESDLLDARLDALKSLNWPDDEEAFEQLAAEILADHSDDRRVHEIRLHLLDNSRRKERLPLVVEAADGVLGGIDEEQLTLRLSGRVDPDDAEATADRKEAEAMRDLLIDTLYRKGRALAYMELPDVIEEHPIADQAAHDELFEQNFRALARLIDTTEEDYFLLHVRRDRRQGRFGQAIELLNEYIDDPPATYLHYKKRRDLYGELGWEEWRDYEARWMRIRFPEGYQPF